MLWPSEFRSRSSISNLLQSCNRLSLSLLAVIQGGDEAPGKLTKDYDRILPTKRFWDSRARTFVVLFVKTSRD